MAGIGDMAGGLGPWRLGADFPRPHVQMEMIGMCIIILWPENPGENPAGPVAHLDQESRVSTAIIPAVYADNAAVCQPETGNINGICAGML